MTASMSWLENYNGNRAALSFIIEGFGTAFSTETLDNTYSIAAAPYADWTSDPTTGMKLSGTLTQGIKLYTPDVEADVVTVSVVDKNGLLIGSMFRENSSAGHTTYLTSSVTAGSTATINVNSTTGFAASGLIYIGGEAIRYTGKTATTFTGITRGALSVNQTDSGSQFAPSHLIGNNVTITARTSPAVSDFPRTWYGRFAHVLLHVRDPLTGQWNGPADATKVVTGRIENYRDEGDGTISIEIKTAQDLLNRPVGHDQWQASINPGIYLASDSDRFKISRVSSSANNYQAYTDLNLSGPYTHDQLAAVINEQLRTNVWTSGSALAGDDWRLELIDPGDGGPPRYRMRVDANTTAFATGDNVGFALHPLAMALLGFGEYGHAPNSGLYDEATYGVNMERVSSTSYELMATLAPIQYFYVAPFYNVELTVAGEINTYISQTVTDAPVPSNADGVVQIKGGRYDGIYAVDYTAASGSTPARVKILAVYDDREGRFYAIAPSAGIPTAVVRVGDDGDAQPVIKQVILYRGNAGAVMLRCLLSSGGASGYNHATYDTITTSGFGVAVPASLVDVDSWARLDDVKVALLIAEPKPFIEYLEPILAVSGRYVVWKASSATAQPKLTIIRPSLDSVYQSTWLMTEANKADAGRTKIERTVDGVINRIVVQYGQGITGEPKNAVNLTVDDIPSQTDYGRRRTVKINAGPVVNVPEIVSQTIAPALAYFSRPVATLERSFNASLMRMAPGDSVTLTDNYVVDPATGTRGATVYCWCLDTRFDLGNGKGTARLVHLPEKNVTYTGKWAPSARVDETAGGGGYSGDVSKILTLKQHEFSDSSATSDALRFSIGDKVRVTQLDAAAPITWVDTVAGTSSTTMTLTTGSGGLWDSTKRYVVEYDDINTVGSTQRQSAFIADASTLSTGFATPTAYEWGHQPGVVVAPSPDYSVGMARPGTLYDDQGEPNSTHTALYLRKAANNLLGYRTRNVLLSTYTGDLSILGTTDTILLVAWCPYFGHTGLDGSRGLKVRVRGRQSGGGTATITVASSLLPPAPTGFSYPTGKNTVSFATASATDAWSSEMSLSPFIRPQPGQIRGTWISVYASGSGGGVTAFFNSITVVEAGL